TVGRPRARSSTCSSRIWSSRPSSAASSETGKPITLYPRPLVSVCVATYNRVDLLTERCLPSILGQTYDCLDVVVMGDGCTDGTADRVDRIGDPRVRFVNQPAGRYPDDPTRRWMVAGTPALNRGLDLARGDFVTHLDDDDEYHLD